MPRKDSNHTGIASGSEEIPKIKHDIVGNLIHQKLDQVRSGDLYVSHDLQGESVNELLSDPAVYKTFEIIIAKTWMDIDMLSNNEQGLNGGKLNRKKKMYIKALRFASDFVRDQIESYILQHCRGQNSHEQRQGVDHDDSGHDDIVDGDNADNDDGESFNHPHDQAHADHDQTSQNPSTAQEEENSQDSISSLSDGKISRSSSSIKRKKKKKSKKKRHKDKKRTKSKKDARKDKDKSKQKKRKRREDTDDESDPNDDMDEEQRRLAELRDNDDEDDDDDDGPPPLSKREQKRHRRRLEKAKILFEKEKEEILKKIPPKVTKDFRSGGFAKWGKDFLPIMQVGPYDVGPGSVRDQWKTMFENVRS